MFGAIKDSIFFSRISARAKEVFEIDLVKADRTLKGAVNEAAKMARANGFNIDEGAASCVVLSSCMFVDLLKLDGVAWDYSKMDAIRFTVEFLFEKGNIRKPVYDRIMESVHNFYALVEEKTGTKRHV